jgi:hypothetical protein
MSFIRQQSRLFDDSLPLDAAREIDFKIDLSSGLVFSTSRTNAKRVGSAECNEIHGLWPKLIPSSRPSPARRQIRDQLRDDFVTSPNRSSISQLPRPNERMEKRLVS